MINTWTWVWGLGAVLLVAGCGDDGTTSDDGGRPDNAGGEDAIVPDDAVGPDVEAEADAGPDADGDGDLDDASSETGDDASPEDGTTGPFPVSYDRSRIELVSTETIPAGTVSYRAEFYRNMAYRCGRTGHFVFLVVERTDQAGLEAPLWVLMHGGGTGYYDTDGDYHPGNEGMNDEESADGLAGFLLRGVDTSTGRPRDNVIGHRITDGYRFLMPSMCDHDLYAGMGNEYPNNPNWTDGDFVEGLLATMAAIHFTARGNGLSGPDALPGHPTSRVFLHGGSAGSAGAYHVSAAFARHGIRLNGALLDCYVVTSRHEALFAAGCTPLNADPAFDMAGVVEKVGPFVADPGLLLEANIGGAFEIPYFDLQGQADPHCCGDAAPIPEAVAAGFDNNCDFVHDLIQTAIAAHSSSPSQVLLMPGMGHVIASDPGLHQAVIEAWLAGVLAGEPPSPVFP